MPDDTFGQNSPIAAPSPEAIRGYLEEIEAAVLARRTELVEAFGRMPDKIEDEETAQRGADFSKQLAAARKDAEARRVGAKAPWDQTAATVQAFYKPVIDELEKTKQSVDRRIQGYLQAKAEAARREAAERERIAREAEDARRREAEKAERDRAAAEKAARKATDEQAQAEAQRQADDARRRVDEARASQEQANADRQGAITDMAKTSTENSRTRGEYGALASLRKTFEAEVEDMDAVPRQFLMLNNQAVRDHIRDRPEGKPPTPVAGLRFVEKQQAVVR